MFRAESGRRGRRQELASTPKIGFRIGFAETRVYDSFQQIGFDLLILFFRGVRPHGGDSTVEPLAFWGAFGNFPELPRSFPAFPAEIWLRFGKPNRSCP
jgi:hypothetical protein